MFLSKVFGSAQHRLFLKLQKLYQKGLTCLLQISSIRSYINDVLCNHTLSVCSNECFMKSEADFDIEHIIDLCIIRISDRDLLGYLKALDIIEQFIELPLTPNQVIALQRLTASVFQNIAFLLYGSNKNISLNKHMYIVDRISRNMLKLAAGIGYFSDRLYLAIYYYETKRYRKADTILTNTKANIVKPFMMHDRLVNEEEYIEAVGGKSMSTKMRNAIAGEVILEENICFISELFPEQQFNKQHNRRHLCVPVFVMFLFLEFLCYRQSNPSLSRAALFLLHELIHYFHPAFIYYLYRDISWEILGISHHIVGNFQDAFHAYQQSLTQCRHHDIQTITLTRMLCIIWFMLHHSKK